MTEETNLSESPPESQDRAALATKAQETSSSEPSTAQRVLRWIFRMLVVILLGIALGAGLFYGARSFYRDAIEPLQTMDQRMLAIEASVSELNESIQDDKSTVMEEMADLRADLAEQAEEVASLSAQIARLELKMEEQTAALGEITDLREELDQFKEDLASSDDQLQALEEIIQADELPAERVQENLQLMRVMNLMTRARLWIEQDNYGLAGEDIEAALGIMQILSEGMISEEEEGNRLLDITDRLTLVLEVLRT
ncbi:MAG: hypothetical protein PVG04_10870, partial [Anaerolineales bacterium]